MNKEAEWSLVKGLSWSHVKRLSSSLWWCSCCGSQFKWFGNNAGSEHAAHHSSSIFAVGKVSRVRLYLDHGEALRAAGLSE
jgi:hypothetical protein